MLREANIGIAINCQDNFAALNSCDIAIPKFKFLTNLLEHGRSNFIRLENSVMFTFYKNFLLATQIF